MRPGLPAILCVVAALAWPNVAAGEDPASSTGPDPLEAGRDAFHEGRFGVAIDALQHVLVGPIDATTRADARHLLGRALLAAGEPARAIEVLEPAIREGVAHGTTTLLDHLRWSLARAYDAVGRHEDAAVTFAEVVEDPEAPMASEAAYRQAVSLERAGRADDARLAFARQIETWPDARVDHEARVRLAGLEAEAGHIDRAVRLYREVLRLNPRSRAGVEAGLELERLADAGHAEARPVEGTGQEDELEWLVRERRFEEARAPLEALRERARTIGDGRLEARVTELLARLFRETGDHAGALTLYRWLDAHGHPVSTRRFVELLAALGRHEEAERELASIHHGRRTAAWWRDVAELREEHGRYREALAAWRRATGRRVSTSTLVHLAWCTLWAGKAEQAVPLLEKVGERDRGRRLWSRYWSARALALAGRVDAALARFDALVAAEPLDYYGIMAASRAAELRGAAPDVPVAVASSDDVAPAAPESTIGWSAETRVPAWDAAPRPLPRAERLARLRALARGFGEAAPEARRAEELARLGFDEDALTELRVIDTDRRVLRGRGWRGLISRARSDLLDNRRDPRARGGAAAYRRGRRGASQAREFGRVANDAAFVQALRRAQTALGDAYALRRSAIEAGSLGDSPTAETADRWRAAYPMAWPEAVATFTSAYGVPGYFLYAIMTVESTFHPHAVSVSDAYGLLQVIPRTGRRVAAELGFGEFSPEILLEPHVAIYMGSHYMGRLLRKFHGQELLAAAAYNAGPHRVALWLDQRPDEPMDAFLEEIPFRQARHYARRVLEYTARYLRVYHGQQHVYVSNRLDRRYLAEPNY
ncbi:MAG: transglycosylase SLT domain-containing protein [Deltaproteobacteria bacterium]|nr:transglycosylase SLT domain-containing protein [Deltaproteobacteria bacterium]MCB9789160.1 transglycosylase SLT domain-containing protein [Deltaproteobacteria bacterium]